MKNQKGQGLIEYLILVALIAIAGIAVVSTVGDNLREQYANVSDRIRGENPSRTLSRVKESEVRHRGLNDYYKEE